jgi:hypothetical protein
MKLILSAFTLLVLSSFSLKVNKTALFSNSKVTIEGITQGCNDAKNGINKEFIFLNFTNKTSKAITVTYYTELFYNGTCYTCNSKEEEYIFTITVPANGSVSGDCSNKSQKLAIFSKMLDGVKASELTNYSIKNVVVK